MLALVATYGVGRQAYGLFLPAFRAEFGLSLDVLGYYASAAQAGYLVATILTGILTARFGPRLPVVGGCLLFSAGAFLTASADDPVHLAVGIIAAGTSAGGAWGPFSDAVEVQVPSPGTWRALALVNAGSPLGLVVAASLVLVAGGRWRLAWGAFAIVGLLAAATNWRVLAPRTPRRRRDGSGPRPGWFVDAESIRLLTVALGVSITSGAYFAYAPDTAQEAGAQAWVGPVMWAALGAAGVLVGVFGGGIGDRYGLRRPLVATLVLVAAAPLALQVAPGTLATALLSAVLFGTGFTTGFALLVLWSQRRFHARPTTGFTIVIVCVAAGFAMCRGGVRRASRARPAAAPGPASWAAGTLPAPRTGG